MESPESVWKIVAAILGHCSGIKLLVGCVPLSAYLSHTIANVEPIRARTLSMPAFRQTRLDFNRPEHKLTLIPRSFHSLHSPPSGTRAMTDPFSVSAGVVGVVSLGLTLGQGFARYYGPWRDYDDEIRGFTTKVDGLLNTLRLLNSFLSPQSNLQLPSNQYRLLVLDNLASCKEACQRLEKMLDECKMSNLNTSSSAFPSKRDWLRLKRMAYPFKKDTLVTLSGLVSGLQDNLSLALQLFQR
jgi:hypothetical protein